MKNKNKLTLKEAKKIRKNLTFGEIKYKNDKGGNLKAYKTDSLGNDHWVINKKGMTKLERDKKRKWWFWLFAIFLVFGEISD